MELGLGYLTFDRAASTPSTRGTSADAVRNRMTGVLYVLDVPDRTALHEHRRTPARHAGTACRRECDHPRRPLCSDFEHGRSFYRTRSSGRAGDFSYNTGVCAIRPAMGRGVNLDIQFLPDVTIYCPDCDDTCYQKAASEILRTYKKGEGAYFLPTLMSLRVAEALDACRDLMIVRHRLQILHKLGCAYLTLGEVTTGALGRRSAAPETRQ